MVWQVAEQAAEGVLRRRPARALPGDVASHVLARLIEPTKALLRGLDVMGRPGGVNAWIYTTVAWCVKGLQVQEVNARKLSRAVTDEFNRRLRETPPDVLIHAEDRRTLLAAIDRVRQSGPKDYRKVQAAIALDVEGVTAQAVAKKLKKSTSHTRALASQGRHLLATAVKQVTEADRERVEPRQIASALDVVPAPGKTTDSRKRVKRQAPFARVTPKVRQVIASLPRRQREIFTAAYVDKALLGHIAQQFRLKQPTSTIQRSKRYFLHAAQQQGLHLRPNVGPSPSSRLTLASC